MNAAKRLQYSDIIRLIFGWYLSCWWNGWC